MSSSGARKTGRPTLCTPKVRTAILKALKKGLPLNRAAVAVGIGRSTLQLWRTQAADGDGPWPTIEVDIAKARNESQGRWLGKIEKASKGSWTAAAWLLERTDRETYALQNTVQIQIQVAKEREALLDLAEEVLDRASYDRLLEACAARGAAGVLGPGGRGRAPASESPETVH